MSEIAMRHVEVALDLIDWRKQPCSENDGSNPEADRMVAMAQVHATLALVEQQRIANDRVQYCPHGDSGVCMYCLRDTLISVQPS